ncbi:hypothetical protein K491DRAFT_710712 [Lophiostoma macrostomum CBS 122681]|uniref:DUF7730 domain-containing protein n=1 Tax=Lophiostoma macrostomum CBS 122681 TaxID=1314788 RepID=A0A6A6TNV5_9PLEO|nr:hypothetical protein K491DRAFT_710712 [Lophiostoma macrostomum CBS 122681]
MPQNIFRFMDLPAELRTRIYQYVLGFRVFCVSSRSINMEPYGEVLRPSLIQCDCKGNHSKRIVSEQWDDARMEATSCHYHCLDHRKIRMDSDATILQVSRQAYAEAKNVSPSHNIFSFTDGYTLRRLSEGPYMRSQMPHITKLALVFYPRFPELSDWNEDLEALYKSRRTPLFPSLNMLQLHVYNAPGKYPQFDDEVDWSELIWVWGLLYLAKENMNMINVDSASFSYKHIGSNLPESNPSELITPSREEQEKYEAMIKSHLLPRWTPKAKNHIEQLARLWRKKSWDTFQAMFRDDEDL